ncbi:MAG: type IV pilin protein [Bdellovibrionia bacterium]
MLKSSRFSNTKGFSLVELMVVVAIIGILAAIAVPSVSKYMAKARQSEAKSNLASLYTSQKAFFAEYNTFDSRFAAVGYTPEGQLRYDVGFTAGVVALPANGYHTPPANAETRSGTYCPTAVNSGCIMLTDASGVVPTLVDTACSAGGGSAHPAACTTAVNTFRAGALSRIVSSAAVDDQWSIDELKVMRNTINGIP